MTLPGAAQVAAAAGSRAASIDEGAPELVRGAVHLVLDGEQVLKSVTCKGANQFYTGVELQNSMDAASLAAIQFERRVVRLRDWARAKCFTVVMDGAEDSAVTPRREAQGRLSDAHREMLQAQEAAAAAAGDHTARARHLARLAELKAAHVAESRVFYEVLRRRMASHGIRFIVSLAQGKHQAMAELRASGGGVSASAGGDGLVVAGPLPGGGAISWLSLDLRCEPRFVLDGSRAELAPGGAWSEMHRMLYALCQPTDYFGGIPGMGPEKAMQMAAACTLPDGARFIEEVVPWAREYCQEQGWSTPPLATWQAGAAACLEGYWCAPVLVPQSPPRFEGSNNDGGSGGDAGSGSGADQ